MRWGRELYGYIGGAWVADEGPAAIPTKVRERMVLTTPWYAVGAPDLDMSKYEVITRSDREVIVHWEVRGSANKSVMLDIGYVAFRAIRAAGRDATLVLFSSLHRIDPGPVGRIMPGGLRAFITEASLRKLFAGHIQRYRSAVKQQR